MRLINSEYAISINLLHSWYKSIPRVLAKLKDVNYDYIKKNVLEMKLVSLTYNVHGIDKNKNKLIYQSLILQQSCID